MATLFETMKMTFFFFCEWFVKDGMAENGKCSFFFRTPHQLSYSSVINLLLLNCLGSVKKIRDQASDPITEKQGCQAL
jgi:hypothetical protein